jgi:RimJ/RimL family protein N-acetyltransferase
MLCGNLTRLRPFENEDIALYRKWMENPNTVKKLHGTLIPFSWIQMEAAYSSSIEKPGQSLLLIIETKEDRKPIGFCFVKNIHPLHRHAELEQLHIIPEYQDQGIGTDVMKILLDYFFLEANLNRIWLISYADNKKAIRFYHRLGFVIEGVLRQIQFTMGKYHNGCIMGILRDDWLKRKPLG